MQGILFQCRTFPFFNILVFFLLLFIVCTCPGPQLRNHQWKAISGPQVFSSTLAN